MRILDGDNDKKLDTVYLCLTKMEAEQLISDLQDFIENLKQNPPRDHCHLNSEDYKKEITTCTYDESNLTGFHESFKKLILEDKWITFTNFSFSAIFASLR